MEESKDLPIILFEHTDICNSGHLVISDLNMRILPGEFVYIIGKVGSGKTSIIRTIIGEIPVSKGTAMAGGFNLCKLKKRQIPYLRRKIGVVFQDFQLAHDRSVHENLRFVLRATGWKDRRSIDERIGKVLAAVGMEHKSENMPHQLSGGEQQRIAIARALLNQSRNHPGRRAHRQPGRRYRKGNNGTDGKDQQGKRSGNNNGNAQQAAVRAVPCPHIPLRKLSCTEVHEERRPAGPVGIHIGHDCK